MNPVNIFAHIPEQLPKELLEPLCTAENVTIERIVSRGHCSPDDFRDDQDRHEWVLLLKGKAALLFEGDHEPIMLKPGDYINIPAHTKHRVAWTDEKGDTVWLAVFC